VWNSTPARPEVLAEKIRSVDAACVRHERDPASLPKTLETQVLIYERREDAEALYQRFERLRRRYPPAEGDDLERLFDRIDPDRARRRGLDRARDEFLVGTASEITKRVAQYAEMGISEIICWFMDFPEPTSMERLAREIIPVISA
jgi:alkanesulfonate monooxygenase SsuD/methylene tetrahydromethanopterin reductase-like flavin-dependent oxidoreductase (luciferase family)